jgi:two-component system response regulator RegA
MIFGSGMVQSAEPSAERPQYDAASVGAASILVVDDTYALRERLALAFQQRGFRVEAAANYDEAIARFTARPTDLAVLDLRMPGGSGLDLLKTIKRLNPATRVVLLSGFGSIATAIDAVRSGAVNFLPKPADADDILHAFIKGDGQTTPEEPTSEVSGEDFPVPSLARAEWEHIHRVLSDCGGNISEAARRLGLHRRSLQRKLRKRAPEDPM